MPKQKAHRAVFKVKYDLRYKKTRGYPRLNIFGTMNVLATSQQHAEQRAQAHLWRRYDGGARPKVTGSEMLVRISI
jgi:hypothetical protein